MLAVLWAFSAYPWQDSLVKRAKKADLYDRIETIKCSETSLEISSIKEEIDFALTFAVVHEVPDRNKLFSEILTVLKPGGMLLIAEPKGHVTENDFHDTMVTAQSAGFSIALKPEIGKSHSVLLKK